MISRLFAAVALLCVSLSAQVTVSPVVNPHVTFVDASGAPCAGCTLASFTAGTTTPTPTYTDSTGGPQNTNPIVLSVQGGANIWVNTAVSYKFVLKDTSGTTIWTVDNVTSPAGQNSGNIVAFPLGSQTITQPGGSNFNVNTSAGGKFNYNGNEVLTSASGVELNPTGSQTITQPTGTTLTLNNVAVDTVAIGGAVLYAKSGQTLAAVLTELETISGGAGGVIHLGTGIWQAGGFICNVPNVAIIGAGRPSVNSGKTALTGGTIIQGTVQANQGCSHFVLRDLGVDVGSAWVAAGNAAADAVSIFNNGQVVGATPLDGVLVDNVIGLGSSLSAAFHAILVENVTNSLIHNVVAILNQHGIVLKGTYSHIDGFYSAGHSVDSVTVKSDVYAPSHHDTVTNGTMSYLSTLGDTLGLQINSEHTGTGIPVQYISVSNVQAYGLANASSGAAFFITGAETFNPATDITLSDLIIDWPGGSPTNVACIQLIQSTARVHMSNIHCSNVYVGIEFVSPSSGFMGDMSLVNSQFLNIQTNAVHTYGTWTASGNECNGVTLNCFLNQVGNLNLGLNTIISTGSYFNNTSGTMQFDYRAYANGSAAPVSSPGEVYGTSNATAGQLVVSFGRTFNGSPVCVASVIDTVTTAGNPGAYAWVNSQTATGVVFNLNFNTFNGPVNWSCRGLLQ